MSNVDEGPTVRETYRTLNARQKETLDLLVGGLIKDPLTPDQIDLFTYFMSEVSSDSPDSSMNSPGRRALAKACRLARR